MYYLPENTRMCGYYECKECNSRFLDIKTAPKIICPYCGENPDMEIGPDDIIKPAEESAELIQVLYDEDVEKYDRLLSLAITGGDFNWI